VRVEVVVVVVSRLKYCPPSNKIGVLKDGRVLMMGG
jgi:hypothetical protein